MKKFFHLTSKWLLFAGAIAVLVFILGKFAWDKWTLYAMVVSILYFFGGFRFLPSRTALQMTISVGLFGGMASALIYFLAELAK